jgi:hypothetical protein
MPYIVKSRRKSLDWIIDNLNSVFSMIGFTGNLNYILYKIALRNCRCYKDYALFLGELQAASLEIYRRQVASYEELKMSQNSDVEE